jgi:hypothetical protein
LSFKKNKIRMFPQLTGWPKIHLFNILLTHYFICQ